MLLDSLLVCGRQLPVSLFTQGRRGLPAADLPYFFLQNLPRGLLDGGGEPDHLPDGAGDQGGSLVVDDQSGEWVGRSVITLSSHAVSQTIGL